MCTFDKSQKIITETSFKYSKLRKRYIPRNGSCKILKSLFVQPASNEIIFLDNPYNNTYVTSYQKVRTLFNNLKDIIDTQQ